MRSDPRKMEIGAQQYVVALSSKGEKRPLSEILKGTADIKVIEMTKSAALVQMSDEARQRLSANANLYIEPNLSYHLV